MNSSLLDKPIVLSLNRVWMPIGHRTVKEALIALNGGNGGSVAPALALDIGYARTDDGRWDFTTPEFLNPVPWNQWIELPVREFDFAVHTAKRAIRVPTVIISTHYASMPMRRPRFGRDSIFERDGGICQYTGEAVGRDGGNLDHVVPLSEGGLSTFENVVWAKREVNTRKANRRPEQAGLHLLRPPRRPHAVPASARIGAPRHRDWAHFLK